jgi:signal peptidase II
VCKKNSGDFETIMKTSSKNSSAVFWLGGLALFVIITVIDQILKSWAQDLDTPIVMGWVRIFPFENGGILGGYFADLHPWVIRIFFSVLFGFLTLGGFLLIHFLSHKPVPRLKWGIILYVAGMMGNVWDRMTTGTIIDFIVFGESWMDAMAFNFADFAVFGGALLMVVSIIKDSSLIWHEGDQRRGHWVDPPFQTRLGTLFVLTGLAHFTVIALYSFTFLKVFISGEQSTLAINADHIIRDYLIGLFVIEIGALILTFAASLLVSHRVVGPLVALEQFIKKISHNPEPENLKLRNSDYLKDKVEDLGNLISARFKQPRD